LLVECLGCLAAEDDLREGQRQDRREDHHGHEQLMATEGLDPFDSRFQ